MKLNFAIIGVGIISKYYLEAIKQNRDIHLVAICDLDKSKKRLANELDVRFYTDHRDMINKEIIDCVAVLTPNSTHYNIISDCLSEKINILCEKPLGVNYMQTKNLIDKAKEKDLSLITAYHRRFNNQIIKLKEYSKSKTIRAIHFRYLEDINKHSFGEKWYLDTNKSSGGCLLDNGINVIDVLQYLVGDLKLSFAHLGHKKIADSTCDVNAYLEMANDKGSKCTVELDWLYNGEIKDLSVYFEDGEILRIDLLSGHKEFKGSLWHEYQNIINETTFQLRSNQMFFDSQTLNASKLIDQIYSLKN